MIAASSSGRITQRALPVVAGSMCQAVLLTVMLFESEFPWVRSVIADKVGGRI